MTDSTSAAIRAWLLADSDRCDREQERFLNNWHAGWRAAELELDDAYEEGFLDGLHTRRRFQREAFGEAAIEEKRWSLRGEPRARATFADPHPDDYQGGPVTPW